MIEKMDPYDDDAVVAYRRVLSLHTKTLHYLESIQSAPELLRTYRYLLQYLEKRTPSEIRVILKRPVKHSQASVVHVGVTDLPDEALRGMTLETVKEYVGNSSTSRDLLARIALLRFGVAKSAVSKRHGRRALVEKINNLVANEATHESIRRVVAGKNWNPGK